MALNKISLLGRIATDYTVRNTQKGDKVIRFALAVDHTYDDGSDLFNITVFDNKASGSKLASNLMQYNSKGDEIYVEARLASGVYTDKNGVKQYTTDLLASSVEYVSTAMKNRKNASAQASTTTQASAKTTTAPASQAQPEVNVSDDDLPF